MSVLPLIFSGGASDIERNWLIAALPAPARNELMAASDVIGLRVGDLIAREQTPLDAAWFPDTGCLSVTAMVDQKQVEVGTIGWEGMFGVPLLLGSDITAFRCIVQIPGKALRIRRERLTEIASRYVEITELLRRYSNAWMNQLGRIAACNAVHTTDERLARWLLITHDRVPTEVLPLTHEFLSIMLGVRRASVTIAAHALQEAGLIQYHRGHVRVLDRAGLQGAACECYQAFQSEYTTVRAPRLIDHSGSALGKSTPIRPYGIERTDVRKLLKGNHLRIRQQTLDSVRSQTESPELMPCAMEKPEASLIRCRDSLVSVLLHNPRTVAARRSAADLGAQARCESITPERMLVDLKRAIDDVALMRNMDPIESDETRATLVTIAIDAYYADR